MSRFNQNSMDERRGGLDEHLEGTPPSAKLVAKILENEEGLNQEQISRRARLNDQTTREALRVLVERGVVEAEFDSSEGRRLVYSLSL